MALYFLSLLDQRSTNRPGNQRQAYLGQYTLDEILSLHDFEAIGDTSQVDAAAIATNLAADAACTKLIRHRCLRIESKLHPAALAASFKFPVSTVSVVAGLIWTARRVCI